MKEYAHNGLRLYYEETGEGLPLIFLHGMGGGIGQVRSITDAVPGFHFIIPSLQGHGDSELNADSLSFGTLAEDVKALADRLGLESFYLAGISMGAAISLRLASMIPERIRGILLIRNAWADAPMSSQVRQAFADLAEGLRDGDKETYLSSAGWDIVNSTSDYTRNTFLAAFDKPYDRRSWQKYVLLPGQAPVEHVPTLKMPVTIIGCRGDFVHPYECGEYLHEKLPGSRLVEVPNKDEDPAGQTERIREVLSEAFSPLRGSDL